MKLYEAPRDSLIQIIDVDGEVKDPVYHFYHIDGAYSLCTDHTGNIVLHIGASTDVKVLESTSV